MSQKLPISVAPGLRASPKDPKRERIKAERRNAIAAETEGLLADLRLVGIEVGHLVDLRKATANFGNAIPVLLRHLASDYSEPTKSVIAHLLATPLAAIGWQTLSTEYRNALAGSLKDMLAFALAEAVTPACQDDLLALAQDRRHGTSRVLLLRGLRRSRRPEIKASLLSLASDPDLAKEISSW